MKTGASCDDFSILLWLHCSSLWYKILNESIQIFLTAKHQIKKVFKHFQISLYLTTGLHEGVRKNILFLCMVWARGQCLRFCCGPSTIHPRPSAEW